MRAILVGMLACVSTAAAIAQPMFVDETLLAPMPDGFEVGHQQRAGSQQITEFIPNGETVHDWSAMVTHLIFGNANKRLTIAIMADGIAGNFERGCGARDAVKLNEGQVNGYAYEDWRIACPLNPQTQKPEVLHARFVMGNDALYVLQYAFRAEPSEDRAAIAMTYLASVLICDPRKGDLHPCPSEDNYRRADSQQ